MKAHVPRRGDIVLLDFEPQKGFEVKKRRPALVISHTRFNRLGLAVVCPITSTEPRHGFHVPLPQGLRTAGQVMAEQLKSLDFEARNAAFIESAPTTFVRHIRNIVSQFL